MAEYIDKAQVQTELMMSAERYTVAHESNGFGTVEWSDNLIPVSRAMEIIRNIPTVDAVPVVHGRFEYGEDESGYDGYYCSKCFGHVRWYGKASEQSITFIEKYNYCPFCGARMDAE